MAYEASLIEKMAKIWDENEYFEPKDDLICLKNIFYQCFLILADAFTWGM